MKKITILISLVAVSFLAKSQSTDFEEGMKKGYEIYNVGETHNDWIRGAEYLAELGKKYPNEWLSYYWAAYMYTQIARASRKDPPKGITYDELVNNAQKYLDLASKRVKDKTLEQEVDFHMLQQLTYQFTKPPTDDKEKFKKLADIELKAAIRKDPNHPVLLTSLGIDLLFKGDYTSVYGARVLLLKAKEKYNARIKPRYMSTHYAEQWVNYWEPQTKKKLIELIKG